tara:strand:- start:149173 stop:149805 length:633 start_codon:yes stop_codon:yes gene_type:complete
MFDLSAADLHKSILGCGDGPASFNAALTRQGGAVMSVDPVYQFSAEQLRDRIHAVYSEVMGQMAQHVSDYVWESIPNLEALGATRMAAMEDFLRDYDAGRSAGRYLCASLPSLPFADRQFELALVSHFLFLYSDHLNLQQHIDGLRELCRVAREVRVYPLLSLDGRRSPHLSGVRQVLESRGLETDLRPVRYRFQRGATEMLVVRPRAGS